MSIIRKKKELLENREEKNKTVLFEVIVAIL